MSVTLKEIARKTGFSVPTVGNVLGQSAHRYSKSTRQRVNQAAAELGYRPNSSARAVRAGRFDCAALVLSRSKQQTHSYIPAGLLDGLDEELARHRMHLTVSRLSDEELTDHDIMPKVLREHMADGMIVNYTHEIPPAMLELLRTHRTPAVWINNKLDADCVYPDDFAAAAEATQELMAIGHRRICFVHLVTDATPGALRLHHYSVADRIAGYSFAMEAAGLTPRVFDHDRALSPDEQLGACRAMLTTNSRPTALLLYSDHDLSTLMCAAAYERLDVPRDLSVLVFYPTEPWVCGKQVSNIALPSAEIGRCAVRMLLRKIQSPEKSCKPEAVRYHAHLGQTVAPPRIGIFPD